MKELTVWGFPDSLRDYLYPMGSLRGSPKAWYEVWATAGAPAGKRHQKALERLAEEAVPEPGNPQPQRAVVMWSYGQYHIITPSEVVVSFRELGGDSEFRQVQANIFFHRESIVLAGQIAARVLARQWAWIGYCPPMPRGQLPAALQAFAAYAANCDSLDVAE